MSPNLVFQHGLLNRCGILLSPRIMSYDLLCIHGQNVYTNTTKVKPVPPVAPVYASTAMASSLAAFFLASYSYHSSLTS
jgi:hypothetical protein